VLFDVLVAAGVAGLTGLGIFMRETPPATMPLGYVMALAVLVRRRWPLATMAVVATAALLQVILIPPNFDPQPYDLAVLVAMYSVVKYGKHMRDTYLAAAVVTIGIVLEVVRHPQQPWLLLTLWYLGVCGGVWLMGFSMRNRRIYVATLEERASTLERERDHLARIAVADERAAIARELHDVVAHSLSVMIVQADGGSYAFDNDPSQARQALKTVSETGREALEDMRRLVDVLRGTQVEPTLAGSPDVAEARTTVTVDRIDLLVQRARSAGLAVEVTVTGTVPPLPPTVALSVYRIVQEALTNVLRHAGGGARVHLRLGYTDDQVSVSVLDDGGAGHSARPETAPLPSARPEPIPPPVPSAPPSPPVGHGLVGMRERVNVHGGQLEVGPSDRGWAVQATIPFRAPAVAT
jgi:signal transduction histidine kinase